MNVVHIRGFCFLSSDDPSRPSFAELGTGNGVFDLVDGEEEP